jgi:hypothetical protein
MKDQKAVLLIVAIMLLGWSVNVHAQLTDKIAIHGFGSWAYGKTDNENRYVLANQDGSYDYLDFSLNLSVDLSEELRLYLQPGWSERSQGNEVNMDYAFAEWYVSDLFSFRIGKVKAPFMLYTEIYKVGTLRPFFLLPQGIYTDTAAEGYKGLGVTGSFSLKNWKFQYDVYAGKLSLEPVRYVNFRDQTILMETPQADDAIGGRLMANTPIDGMSFGVSTYSADLKMTVDGNVDEANPRNGRSMFWGASWEYVLDRFSFRGEFLTEVQNEHIKTFQMAYFETAYTFTEHWQAALRIESVDFQLAAKDAPMLSTLEEHRDIAVGINYWFTSNFVIKLAYHHVEGNHFAAPDDPEEYFKNFLNNSFAETTNLIVIGTQFSF